MAKKELTREINIVADSNAFTTFLKKFTHDSGAYNFDGLAALRKLLSNEKAKLLYVVKNKKPNSIYNLAKILGRNFKSVSDDIKLLERFGFVDLVSEKTGKRERLRPFIAADIVHINISI